MSAQKPLPTPIVKNATLDVVVVDKLGGAGGEMGIDDHPLQHCLPRIEWVDGAVVTAESRYMSQQSDQHHDGQQGSGQSASLFVAEPRDG